MEKKERIDSYMQIQTIAHILLPLLIIFIFNKTPTYKFEILLDSFIDKYLFGYIGTYSSNVLFQSKIIVNYVAITFLIHIGIFLFITKQNNEFTIKKNIKHILISLPIFIWLIYLIYFDSVDFYKAYKDSQYSFARAGNIFAYSFREGATLGIGIYTSYLLIQSIKTLIYRFFHKDN